MLIVGVVLLIVVGPDKLPQFARTAGKLYGQLRRTADEMRRSLVLEADRQDADARYKEMLERRKRAEEERRKAAEASPGVTAQDEVLPGAPADAEALALQGPEGRITDDLGHVAPDGDQDLQDFLADPHGPYAAGRSLDDVMTGPAMPGAQDRAPDDLPFVTPPGVGERAVGPGVDGPPPGVSEQEWAELPAHIRQMLRARGDSA